MKYKYTELALPPYPYSIYVFTDAKEYGRYGVDNHLFDKPARVLANPSSGSMGETLDTDNNPKLHPHICLLLPAIGECSDFDLEETIDHEVMHCVFKIFRMVGSKVGMKYGNHEHFAYSCNYLDREIKTKVYKFKDKHSKK